MPVRRSANLRATPVSTGNALRRKSSTTKSLPSPCILKNGTLPIAPLIWRQGGLCPTPQRPGAGQAVRWSAHRILSRPGTRVSGAWPAVLRARRPDRPAAVSGRAVSGRAVSARAMSAGILDDGISTVVSPTAMCRAGPLEARPYRGHFINGRPIALGCIRGPGGYRSGLVGEVTGGVPRRAEILRAVVWKVYGERWQARKGERTGE